MSDSLMVPTSRGNPSWTLSVWLILFGVVPTILTACSESATDVKPAEGTIEVTALAEGVGVFPDSFSVLLNGSFSGSVSPNGVYLIPFLPKGDYQVSLLEEPEECWFGNNARTVTVGQTGTFFTTFLVRCD